MLTFWIESQLSASHLRVADLPVVVTHSTPLVIEAHLHSSRVVATATSQTNVSILTHSFVCWTKYYIIRFM